MVTTLGPTFLITGAKLVRARTSWLSGSFWNLICGSDEAPACETESHPDKIRIKAPKVHTDPLAAPVFFIAFPREFPRLVRSCRRLRDILLPCDSNAIGILPQRNENKAKARREGWQLARCTRQHLDLASRESSVLTI